MKKVNKELDELKKKFANKETLMKLKLDKLSKAEQEVIKVKEENKKIKTELKQAMNELNEARDEAIDLAEVNSKATVKEFNKSPELQKYLSSYGIGFFNMACKDMRRYKQATKPPWIGPSSMFFRRLF